jgi:hypothetical protein
MEALGFKHPWYDPYNQNVWKGDLPMFGDDTFLSLLSFPYCATIATDRRDA